MSEEPKEMTVGVQPIDALIEASGLKNHDVVAADPSKAVTHKVVGKARKGRRLTARMQKKVLAAFNRALTEKGQPVVMFEQAFNYVGH